MARTLQACTAEPVAQLERVSPDSLKRSGVPLRQPCPQALLWVDADVTPLPMGPKAEGSERAWLGRHGRKTGRKTWRCSARDARAILHEPLRRGKAAAVPALQAALGALEGKWGWTRELRQRLVIRLDGGFGTTAVRPWLLSRGSQVVAKMSHRGRVRQLGQQIGPWQPTAREGRAIAAGLAPRRCCRNTRHWVIRTPKETGRDQDAVWVTTLLELPPAELADRYDGRALMEAPLGQDNQGRGLVKRRQRQGEAPQMVWLLGRLAPHLLVWRQRWWSRGPALRWRLPGYGGPLAPGAVDGAGS